MKADTNLKEQLFLYLKFGCSCVKIIIINAILAGIVQFMWNYTWIYDYDGLVTITYSETFMGVCAFKMIIILIRVIFVRYKKLKNLRR